MVQYKVRYFCADARTCSACSFDRIRQEEGVILSQKAIAKVRDAEREADVIRENAAARARTRRESHEVAEARRRDEAIAAERAANRAREQEVRTRAEALISRSREEAEEDITALRTAADAKMREAVKHIEWKVCDI